MEDPLPVAKTVSHHLQVWCRKSSVGTFSAVLLPNKREDFTDTSAQKKDLSHPHPTLAPRRHQAVGRCPQLGIHVDAAHVEQNLLLGLRPPWSKVAPATWYIRCSKWGETQAERKSHFYSCSAGPALGNASWRQKGWGELGKN